MAEEVVLAAEGSVGLERETGDGAEELDDGVGSPCEIGRRRRRRESVKWRVFDDCNKCLFSEEVFIVRTQHHRKKKKTVQFVSE